MGALRTARSGPRWVRTALAGALPPCHPAAAPFRGSARPARRSCSTTGSASKTGPRVASRDYIFEFRRKQRLAESIEQLERHRAGARVKIPVTSPVPGTSLPPDVHLEAGRLTVDFATPEDLLAKLFLLAQNLAADFERICGKLQHPAG